MKSSNPELMPSTIMPYVIISIFAQRVPAVAQQPIREALPHDDFTVREAMVPMRDGAVLYTVKDITH